MIKYGVDGSGHSYYANVYDDDTGECVLSGDGWESPEEISKWYCQLVRATGCPVNMKRASDG